MLKNGTSASPAMAFAKKRFAAAGRADKQNAARNTAAEPLEFFGIFQKFDDFGNFFLGLVNARDILESNIGMIFAVDAVLASAEAGEHSAGAAAKIPQNKEIKKHAPRQSATPVKKERHPNLLAGISPRNAAFSPAAR